MSYLHLIIKKDLSFQYSLYTEIDGKQEMQFGYYYFYLRLQGKTTVLFEKGSEDYYFIIYIYSSVLTHGNVFWFTVKEHERKKKDWCYYKNKRFLGRG